MECTARTRVLLYTRQPFIGEGFAAVLKTRGEFELVLCTGELTALLACFKSGRTDVVLIDMSSGLSLSELRSLRSASPRAPIVLWGSGMGDEFVFQAVQAGIRGLVPGHAGAQAVLAAVQKAGAGDLCFETELMESILFQKRVVLSPRESQLVALVAQGLKNKEIAATLGLTDGTVKVYLTRVFKKLNVSDRLDLALYGLKNFFGNQAGNERSREAEAGRERKLDCPRSLPMRTRDPAAPRLLN